MKAAFNKFFPFFGKRKAVGSNNLHRLIDVPMVFQIRNVVPKRQTVRTYIAAIDTDLKGTAH